MALCVSGADGSFRCIARCSEELESLHALPQEPALWPTRRSARMAQRQLAVMSAPGDATSALPSTLLSVPDQAALSVRSYSSAAAAAVAHSLAPGSAAAHFACESAPFFHSNL